MSQMESVTIERFKIYAVSELLELPGPKWLVDRLFTERALIGVYGPSGEGKTFLALDWALSVAQGEEWASGAVTQGPVVYVAAEGGRSIGKRVRAWMKARGHSDIPEAFFLLEGVQVRDESDLELVVSRIEEEGIEPSLIVLDTLARCFVGGEENSAMEMGQFVEGLEWLRRKTGAAVMVLHHTGKQAQEMERGSTALRGAADVMIRVSKKDNLITVRNNKQKDDEEFKDIHLRLKQVALSNDDDPARSCVLEATAAKSNLPDGLSARLKKTLTALASSPDQTATTTKWATRASIKERTLHSHRQQLVSGLYVEEVQRGIYRVTEEGQRLLGTAASASHLHLVKS